MSAKRSADAPALSFSQSARQVALYDFMEVTLNVRQPTAATPFTDVEVKGSFTCPGQSEPVEVDGFCGSTDGSVYRVRFMPRQVGRHAWKVTYRDGAGEQAVEETFEVVRANRRGPVRVDPDYPYHFIWEGTREHYFWNGTTAYWLAAWQDDEIIEASIERLHRLGVNYVRAALVGRVKDGNAWFEPNVVATDKFSFILCPWVAARPTSMEDPGVDVTRFDPAFWEQYERLLSCARERDVIVSVVFYVDGARKGTDPFGRAGAGGPDEQRFYRYAVARLAAFSNVSWDITNEYQLFRDEAWVDKMGAFVKQCDPYDHVASVHGHGEFPFRTSQWADFAMYQCWDEHGGHDFMLRNRCLQAESGRPMPQVNEEYGYEDHYPQGWGESRKAPARSADNRRRLAWGMCMAGCYQTTGERADRGTGRGADTGGGWINGRGDDTMTMLVGYSHMRAFFESFEWWKAEPRDDLVTSGAGCLAEPGRQYAVYLPAGGSVTVRLEPGSYRAQWFDPRTGQSTPLPPARGPSWTSPPALDGEDWALLLRRQ